MQALGSWRMRRKFLFYTSAFCGVVIAYIILMDKDTETARAALNSSFLILGTNVASYVFGAAWDDRNKLALRPDLPVEEDTK